MKKKETLHIYTRCSTDSQIETSIERQKEMGIKFSKEMGMDYKIWTDEGKSGIKSFEDTREQFTELMWEVELGSVKHLWCEDFTRLTRNYEDGVKIEVLIMDNDLFVYEGLLNNQIYQPNELSQRLIKVVSSMIGTDMKKGEIQKGINQKIKMFQDGLYIRGNWSYGYDKKDGYLVVNEEESKWVKKIFEWYSNGNSQVQIQKKLKVHGIKTKRGNDWGQRSVCILLGNKNYIGIDTYTDMTKDPHRKNPKKFPYLDESTWVVYSNNNIPKIVSDELFQKCQNRFTKLKPQLTKQNYLLHGRIKCGCGCDWVGRRNLSKGNYYGYYVCTNSMRRYDRNRIGRNDLYERNICNKPKRIPTDKLDNLVWNNLLDTLTNSSFIKERVKRDLLGGKYDTSSSRKRVNKELKDINKEIKSLKKSRVSLLKEKFLYELSEVDFNEIDSSITQKMSELKSDLQKVLGREILLDKRSEWIDWIGQHHKDVEEYRKVTDVKQRRRILDIYIDKTVISYDHETQQHDIKLHYRYPLVKDGIEYTRDNNSKMKWDKWGNGYKIKKGDKLISLSDLSKSKFVVSNHSTVVD